MATCEACNTIPQVVTSGYKEKGKWIELAGLKVYSTGSETSTKAIVDIYDVFGPAPQTLQGADLLASALGALVLVPDFFKGEPIKTEWFQPGPENERLKTAFMEKVGKYDEFGAVLRSVIEDGKGRFPGVEGWAALGLCWGGKVTALNSGEGTLFKVSAQVHPGRLAKEDAEKITIPHIVLASNGEPEDVVAQYKEILESEGRNGVVETYKDMHHGWMGARANFEDENNLKEYERGYNQVASFFAKHL
ncbi:hypothetical protein B0O99DRAFT_272875 [Bisporella sp. PMI_857]|nr:hypothetical protein B0O99DRAFT_272875 [Bisporella sp. PMI_857]